VRAAVRAELAAIAAAPEGSRNDQLNRSSFALARFVAAGRLDRAISELLIRAGVQAGLPEREARATVASALRSRVGAA
jgi:hypothetical protein